VRLAIFLLPFDKESGTRMLKSQEAYSNVEARPGKITGREANGGSKSQSPVPKNTSPGYQQVAS
jgi:hypothetical protein